MKIENVEPGGQALETEYGTSPTMAANARNGTRARRQRISARPVLAFQLQHLARFCGRCNFQIQHLRIETMRCTCWALLVASRPDPSQRESSSPTRTFPPIEAAIAHVSVRCLDHNGMNQGMGKCLTSRDHYLTPWAPSLAFLGRDLANLGQPQRMMRCVLGLASTSAHAPPAGASSAGW